MINKPKVLSLKETVGENSKLNNVTFEEYNEIGIYNFIENTDFGRFSYTGQFCFIQNTKVGRYVNIAASVRIGPTDHPMERPTLHHFTYRPQMYSFDIEQEKEWFDHRASRVTTIGHDTWIGHGAIILPEITIGNGAVVGSGAIVTKDVPPYAIVVGVPAKIVRYRFDDETIDRLQKLKWWDWEIDKIKENYSDFKLPINEFLNKYEGEKND